MLLQRYFQAHSLPGKTCVVLGTEESEEYVRLAGGRPVPAGKEAEVLVVADQAGFSFIETVDAALSGILRRLDAGRDVYLLLCNPDLICPCSAGRYGITAGSVAAMMEAVLRERHPNRNATFILGAQRFGIDSALVLSGLTRDTAVGWPEDGQPTYRLESLQGLDNDR